jgi:hypothetical protein
MKRTLFLSLIIATFISCSKKEDNTTPTTNNNVTPNTNSVYYIEGKADGVYIKADMIPAGTMDSTYTYYKASVPLVSMTKYANFSLSNMQSWGLSLYYNLDAITVPHTYNCSVDDVVLGYTPAGGFTYPYVLDPSDSSATLTVTSKTGDVLEGTFNGTMISPTDTIVVTSGKFKVKVVRK